MTYLLAFLSSFIFVGLKMVWLNEAFGGKFPISWSLGIIAALIGGSAALSLLAIAMAIHSIRGAEPDFDWVISAGGKLHDKVRGLAVDPSGNILLTGEFTGEVAFGDLQLKAAGSMDFFVAKVSPEGKFLWPGFGDNLRVLKWVLERAQGKGAATDTVIGAVPAGILSGSALT